MNAGVDLYEGKYFYQPPPMPTDEREIMGYQHKRSEQYWRRSELPDPFEWERMLKTEQYEIVDRERQRFDNGVWFFNNGTPTYITGMHYDHLVNATFDFGKASYYDSHRLDFYWRDLIEKDPRSCGQLVIKPRRYGYSLQEITHQTCTSIRDYSRFNGMMSNNKDKTYESLFNPLVSSYMMRPEWVRPDIYMPNDKIPKMKLWWNKGKAKKTSSYLLDNSGYMNSTLIPKPTTVMGYDGNKVHYLTMDEVWKWVSTNPYDCWKKQRPCLYVGTDIIGKASLLSTMGDDDDYEEAIMAGIQMFHDSDPTERDENGQTKTGLYHRFISGQYSLFNFADPYGYIDMDRATSYILNKRKAYTEGSTEYIYEVRKYPLTLEEALSTASGIGIFDKPRINKAIEIREKICLTKMGDLHEDPKGRVLFEPNNNGKWEIYKLPLINKDRDYSNRWYKDPIEENIRLRDNPQGALGYDPVRYAVMDTTSQSLSMAAIIGYQKFDYYGNGGANEFVCMYHDRPDDPEIAHYEAIKAAKLYGFPIAVERQVESMVRRCRELNAVDLLLYSNYDGKLGFWSTPKTIKDAIDLLQGLWKKPLTPEQIDRILNHPFIKVLIQARDIDPNKMLKFDIMVAVMQVLLGAVQIKENIISDEYNNHINSIFNVIQPVRTNTWKNTTKAPNWQ